MPRTCLSSYPEFRMIGGSRRLKNSVCLKVCVPRNHELNLIIFRDAANQHFTDQMAGRESYNQAHKHPGENREYSLMYGLDTFDLDIIRSPQREDEQHAEDR